MRCEVTGSPSVPNDLELAFRMIDAADGVTSAAWMPGGTAASYKADGSPVTDADVAAESAMLAILQREAPEDGFLGEETGVHRGSGGRRWIADGIDGTRFYAAGAITWGTLLALEVDGVITVAVCSSPLQQRRWWAIKGGWCVHRGYRTVNSPADQGQLRPPHARPPCLPPTVRVARRRATTKDRTGRRRTTDCMALEPAVSCRRGRDRRMCVVRRRCLGSRSAITDRRRGRRQIHRPRRRQAPRHTHWHLLKRSLPRHPRQRPPDTAHEPLTEIGIEHK